MGWILSRDLEGTDLLAHQGLREVSRAALARSLLDAPADRGRRRRRSRSAASSALVWGFAVSQVLCWHGTFTINSLSHLWGGRRYATDDDSRNNPLLALITMGEGWHNNHHHYQVAARQGFCWWEIDCTYYVLRALAAVGLVWDLHGVPEHIVEATKSESPSPDVA